MSTWKSFGLVLVGAMLSLLAASGARAASVGIAGTTCPTDNGAIRPGSNTSDPSRPFFVDTTGLDTKTTPPTRDPADPHYPRATALADGALPSAAADGNFILGPTHGPAAETAVRAGSAARSASWRRRLSTA